MLRMRSLHPCMVKLSTSTTTMNKTCLGKYIILMLYTCLYTQSQIYADVWYLHNIYIYDYMYVYIYTYIYEVYTEFWARFAHAKRCRLRTCWVARSWRQNWPPPCCRTTGDFMGNNDGSRTNKGDFIRFDGFFPSGNLLSGWYRYVKVAGGFIKILVSSSIKWSWSQFTPTSHGIGMLPLPHPYEPWFAMVKRWRLYHVWYVYIHLHIYIYTYICTYTHTYITLGYGDSFTTY